MFPEISKADEELLAKIRIVLVEPSHPGNIGSVARAMKTMGLSTLYVVSKADIITPESKALSKNAFDVLEHAVKVDTLDEALSGVHFAAGTSARKRTIDLPIYEPREALTILLDRMNEAEQTAIVFGRERTGLTNEELERCDIHICISANPVYSSLNLAMSVQVVAYEMRQIILRRNKMEDVPSLKSLPPDHEQVEKFYDFLKNKLQEAHYLRPDSGGHVMSEIRRIYAKADLTQHEMKILFGTMIVLSSNASIKYKKK